MSEDIDASVYVAKNKRTSIYPWTWLFEADRDGSSGFFLAGSIEPVTYGGVTYTPFPIAVNGLDFDSQSSLPTPSIVVSNVSREVAIEVGTGNFIDRTCRIYLYSHEADMIVDKGRWRIVSVTATLDTATFSLAQQGLMDSQVPSRRQERGRCDYVYGGTECRYLTTLVNLVSVAYPSFDGSTCDLTLDGANGCRAHGANEVANGKPRLHPLRFGGLPGIPKGPARV